MAAATDLYNEQIAADGVRVYIIGVCNYFDEAGDLTHPTVRDQIAKFMDVLAQWTRRLMIDDWKRRLYQSLHVPLRIPRKLPVVFLHESFDSGANITQAKRGAMTGIADCRIRPG